MTRASKTLAVFSLVVLFSLFLMESRQPAAQAQDGTDTATMAATQTAVVLDNGWQLVEKRSVDESDKPKLRIEISKPVLTGAEGPALDGFNKQVADIVDSTVTTFKTDTLQNEAAATLPPEIENLGSFIGVNYDVLNTRHALISIRFNVGWYSAGAAHPNSYSVSLNYDLTHAKALALADLFKPNARYLEALSAYSIKTLRSADRLDFPEGAAPKDENFRSWNITPDGLQINFDDYQVTPHAVGPQQVVVPYSTLKGLIRSDGPLAAFVK